MEPLTNKTEFFDNQVSDDEAVNLLRRKLDQAIDDYEQGRYQTIDEVWEELGVL